MAIFTPMIQMEDIRRVDAASAFAELAAHRVVFMGDSQHNCPQVRSGLLHTLVHFLPAAPHRDVCLEGALEGVVHLRTLAQAYHFPPPSFSLHNCVERAEALFADNTSELSNMFGLCVLGIGHVLGGQVHAVDLTQKALQPVLNLARKSFTEQNIGKAVKFLADFREQRHAMDPEIAANIWYATRQRPACVVFGADHLNPLGLPSHFPAQDVAAMIVYRDTDHLKAEVNLAAQNCAQLHPGYHACVSHAYLATEKIWLKMRAPHA